MRNILNRLSLLVLLVSCEASQQRNANNPITLNNNDDRNYRQFVEAMSNITAKLNLPDLKKGVDSFEMRIWCPMSAYIQNIVTIRYIYSHWFITETIVWESYPERELKRNDTVNHLTEVVIDSTKSRTIILKTEKEKVIDTLLNRFVMFFPKRSDLEGSFQISTDSYRYIFEIAEKDAYQMLNYNCGGDIVSKEEFHNKLRDFLMFLRRHINEKIPVCN